MKLNTLLVLSALAALTACNSGKTRIGNYGQAELGKIQHICILDNPKSHNRALVQNIADALNKHGISSETVDIVNDRKRLYDAECRYNLRYNTRGNSISLLIRTPEHPVSSLRDKMTFTQNVQQQTDALVGRLLGKTAY